MPEIEAGTVGEAKAKQRARQEMLSNDPADRRYRGLVESTAQAWAENNKRSLTFYYDIGTAVNDLTDSGAAKYGERTIESFAKDLRSAGATSVSLSQLYKSRRFSSLFSKVELKKLIQAGWAWRNLAFLIADQVPDNIRKSIIHRVEQGEIRQDRVRKQVIAEVPALGQRARRLNRSVDVSIRRAANASQTYREQLAALPKIIQKIREYKPQRREQLKEEVGTLRSDLKDTIKTATEQLKALEDLKF